MAKYEGTYACGHGGVINLIGPLKDREWRKEREFSKLCPDCWKIELEERKERENREAAEMAKEMELPELSGSPKQIAWANTLRQRLIEQFEALTETDFRSLSRRYRLEIDEEAAKRILYFILENRTSAKYFIESRYDIDWLIFTEYKPAMKTEEDVERERAEKELEEQIRAEASLFPEERKTDAVAEIHIVESGVSVTSEWHESFPPLLRSLNYRWDGKQWHRLIDETTGSAEDRAAELGNRLLNAGFPIRIFDEKVRQMAVDGTFVPEQKRWILKVKGEERFAISWTDGSDLYRKARSLPGSRWARPYVLVSVEHASEVEEFAELYGFRFGREALRMIERHRRALENAEVVQPAQVEEEETKDGLKDLLEAEVDVIDDLRD